MCTFFFNQNDNMFYISSLKLHFMLDSKCHYMCFVFLWAERFKEAWWEYINFHPCCLYFTRDLVRNSFIVCVHTYPLHLESLYSSAVSLRKKKLQRTYSPSHPNVGSLLCPSSPLTTRLIVQSIHSHAVCCVYEFNAWYHVLMKS